MKQLVRIVITVCLALLLLPALAQRGGGKNGRPEGPKDGPRHGGGAPTLQGWVADVREGVVTLALLTRVGSPDAPGKVPAQYAQNAATLRAQAEKLEAQGEKKLAEQHRQQANFLLCWREISYTLKPDGDIPIIGVRPTPMQQVDNTMRLRIPVEVDGDVREGQIPANVRQAAHAIQVGPTVPAIARIRGTERNRTFMILVGAVVSSKPLVLDVNGTRVQIETPPANMFLQQTLLTPRNLLPGQRVMARAEMAAPQEIRTVKRLLVTYDKQSVPLEPQDDLQQ